jgi:hypothetical protein
MDPLLLACLAIGLGLVIVRIAAARRVNAGHGTFAWLVFLPTMLPGIALIVMGATALEHDPALAFVFIALGLVFLAPLVWFLRRASRSVSTAPPGADAVGAMSEPLADLATVWVVVPLAIGVIAVIGLIVWGVLIANS